MRDGLRGVYIGASGLRCELSRVSLSGSCGCGICLSQFPTPLAYALALTHLPSLLIKPRNTYLPYSETSYILVPYLRPPLKGRENKAVYITTPQPHLGLGLRHKSEPHHSRLTTSVSNTQPSVDGLPTNHQRNGGHGTG
jgi:hypothetical protein